MNAEVVYPPADAPDGSWKMIWPGPDDPDGFWRRIGRAKSVEEMREERASLTTLLEGMRSRPSPPKEPPLPGPIIGLIPPFTHVEGSTLDRLALVAGEKIDGTRHFYISTAGSDRNPGTHESPWKSLWWVRWMASQALFLPGDTYHFRRDGRWTTASEADAYAPFRLALQAKYPGTPSALLDAALALPYRAFFDEGYIFAGFRIFLYLPDSGNLFLPVHFKAYGKSGDPPILSGTFEHPGISGTPSPVESECGPGWPVSNIPSSTPQETWLGVYIRNQSNLWFDELTIQGFETGARIEGNCTGIFFESVTFQEMGDKGCVVTAIEGDGYWLWENDEYADLVAGYDGRVGHYPDFILFHQCTFAWIGYDTDANALLLSFLSTRVFVLRCTCQNCIDGIGFNCSGTGHVIEECVFQDGMVGAPGTGEDYSDGDGLDIQCHRPRTQSSFVDPSVDLTMPVNWEDPDCGVLPTVVAYNEFRNLPGKAMEVQHGTWFLEVYSNQFTDCQKGIRIFPNSYVEVYAAHYEAQWDRRVSGALPATLAPEDAWSVADALDGGGADAHYHTVRQIKVYRNIFTAESITDASVRGQDAALLLQTTPWRNPVLGLMGDIQVDQMVFVGVFVMSNTFANAAGGQWTGNVGFALKLAAEYVDINEDPAVMRTFPLFQDCLVANNVFSRNRGRAEAWLADEPGFVQLAVSGIARNGRGGSDDDLMLERNFYQTTRDGESLAAVKRYLGPADPPEGAVTETLQDMQDTNVNGYGLAWEESWGASTDNPVGPRTFLFWPTLQFVPYRSGPLAGEAYTSADAGAIDIVFHHEHPDEEIALAPDFDGSIVVGDPDIGAQQCTG